MKPTKHNRLSNYDRLCAARSVNLARQTRVSRDPETGIKSLVIDERIHVDPIPLPPEDGVGLDMPGWHAWARRHPLTNRALGQPNPDYIFDPSQVRSTPVMPRPWLDLPATDAEREWYASDEFMQSKLAYEAREEARVGLVPTPVEVQHEMHHLLQQRMPGAPGKGKSKATKKLAKKMGYPVIDLGKKPKKEMGWPIAYPEKKKGKHK